MLRVIFEFFKPLFLLIFLLTTGTFGYNIIENWSFFDGLYMTVISITTVGFTEVRPLGQNGRIFTIFLILGGVGFYGLAINSIFKIFFETNFRIILMRNKMYDKISKLKNHYIICGGGRMSYAIAQELYNSNVPFIIIDNNSQALVSKSKNKWLILEEDALLEETLIKANIEKAIGLASVLPTDADNLFVVLSARSLNKEMRIQTRIAHESSRSKMIQAGADKIVSPYVLGGVQMARSFLQPGVDDFLDIILDKSNYEFALKVHIVTPEDSFVNTKIKDTAFSKENFIIIGVKDSTSHKIHTPLPEFVLKVGHEIILMSTGMEKPLN